MTYITATAKHTVRVFAQNADDAALRAVNFAGRDGLDIFDVTTVRRVSGTTDEYTVTMRIITGTVLEEEAR